MKTQEEMLAELDGIEGPTVNEEDAQLTKELLSQLKQLEVSKGTEHPESLVIVITLARLYYRTRQLVLADFMYYRAFSGAERTHRPTHILVYTFASNYGVCLVDMRQYETAEYYLRKALSGLEMHLGSNHIDLLESMEGLGVCLYIQQQYEECFELFKRALKLRLEHYAADDKETLNAVNNKCKALNALCRFDEAFTLCEETYSTCQKLLGPMHPITLGCIESLAYVLQAKGELTKSLEMYRKAHLGNQKVLGTYHVSTINSMKNCAYILQKLGVYAEAEELYSDSLLRTEKVLGDTDPMTLSIVYKVGLLQKLQEKVCPAEYMLRRSMVQRKKEIGAFHPDTLCSMHQLAIVLYIQSLWKHTYGFLDKRKESFKFYEECIRRREKALGASHIDTITCVEDYGNCLADEKLYEKAEVWFRDCLVKLNSIVKIPIDILEGSLLINGELVVANKEARIQRECETARARSAIAFKKRSGIHVEDEAEGRRRQVQKHSFFPKNRTIRPQGAVIPSVCMKNSDENTPLQVDRNNDGDSPGVPLDFDYYKYTASVAIKHGVMLQRLDRQSESIDAYKHGYDCLTYFKKILMKKKALLLEERSKFESEFIDKSSSKTKCACKLDDDEEPNVSNQLTQYEDNLRDLNCQLDLVEQDLQESMDLYNNAVFMVML